MKKLIFVFAIAIMFSCSSDDSSSSDSVDFDYLVGTWILESATLRDSDGTQDVTDSTEDKVVFQANGMSVFYYTFWDVVDHATYTVNESNSTISVDWDETPENRIFHVVNLTQNRLKMTTTDADAVITEIFNRQ